MRTPSDSSLLPLGEGRAEGEEISTDLALCRTTLYAALALGFQPPTSETLERLTHRDAIAALADAARRFETIGGTSGLSERAVALARPEATLDDLEAEHRRLFGHTARGEVPAYETEYGDEALFQQPHELGDLAGFVQAFGLMLRRGVHERIDHVSCECEFLSFLACKEAYALDTNDDDMRAATTRATTLFLRDHLGRFASAFARRLARADGKGFYSGLGAVLDTLVTADCRRLGIVAGSQDLRLRPDPETVAAPMGCAADAGGECPLVPERSA